MASTSAPPKVKSTKSKSQSKQPSTSGAASSSKAKKSKSIKDAEPERKPISAEFVDDEAEESEDDNAEAVGAGAGGAASAGSESDSNSDSSSEEEEDSEADLEGIEPRRTSKQITNRAQSSGRSSKTLSRYEPPVGMTELKTTTAFVSSPFEWGALANKPGVELWAIRAPKDLKPSRLSALSLTVPRSHSSSSSTGAGSNASSGDVKGNFTYKSTSYTLSSAGSSKRTKAHTVVDEEGRQPTAGPGAADSLTMNVSAETGTGAGAGEEMGVEGGEEMEGMRLLVPRVKQGGKLYVAPLPITRRLILTPDIAPSSAQEQASASITDDTTTTAGAAIPSFLANASSTPIVPSSAPSAKAKRPQPTHLFKFRNEAYGFNTPGPNANASAISSAAGDGMDVDEARVAAVEHAEDKGKKEKEKKDKKDKKDKRRKSDIGTGVADVEAEDKAASASPVKKKAKKSKA
ncbi:hypothetical protein IAT40_000855 [Kwoniella sp. CBS 6097]